MAILETLSKKGWDAVLHELRQRPPGPQERETDIQVNSRLIVALQHAGQLRRASRSKLARHLVNQALAAVGNPRRVG